jgi:hypothetical protein
MCPRQDLYAMAKRSPAPCWEANSLSVAQPAACTVRTTLSRLCPTTSLYEAHKYILFLQLSVLNFKAGGICMLSLKCEIQYFMKHLVITYSNRKGLLNFIMLDASVLQLLIPKNKDSFHRIRNRP